MSNDERRPAPAPTSGPTERDQNLGTASTSLPCDSTSIAPETPARRLPIESVQRRYWAQQLLDAGPNWPMYGTPEWNALPLDDPRRISACVAAAETYTRRYDDLEGELTREIAQARASFKRAEDREYVERAQAHRERYQRIVGGKVIDFAARQRRAEEARRELAEIVRRNPDGRPGGGVA